MKTSIIFYFLFLLFKDPGDRSWVGMWWGGFLICGLLLVIVAIPFFSFPKVLTVRNLENIMIHKNKSFVWIN